MQCESWWNLAKQFASRSPPLHLLSSSVQRSLMKALVLGGFAHMDSDTKQQYWAEVTSAQSCVAKKKLELKVVSPKSGQIHVRTIRGCSH